jgi:hypothetical protein
VTRIIIHSVSHNIHIFGDLGISAIIILKWTLREMGCEGERETEVPV